MSLCWIALPNYRRSVSTLAFADLGFHKQYSGDNNTEGKKVR